MNYLSMVKAWEDIGVRFTAIFAFSLALLSGSIVSQLVRERTTLAKDFQLQNGLSRVTYWLVRLSWDLLKFVPILLTLRLYISEDEP